MNAQEIIEFLGGATAISLTVGYLGQKAIDGYVSGRLEEYKSDLQRITSEHSIRFQRLHSERAEVIKEFYSKLAILDDTLYSTLRGFQAVGEIPLTEKVSHLSDQFNSASTFSPAGYFLMNTCVNLLTRFWILLRVFFSILRHTKSNQMMMSINIIEMY